MASLPGLRPSLANFVDVLDQWGKAPPPYAWFEAPPKRTEKLCLGIVDGDADFFKKSYSTRLTENQAATLIGWLCFAGETSRQVVIVGRNQRNGQQLLWKAGTVASRYLERSLSPRLQKDATADLFIKLRQQYISRWTQGKIEPTNGPSVSVWSTRARQTVDGIVFVEKGARCRVDAFLVRQLWFRYSQ